MKRELRLFSIGTICCVLFGCDGSDDGVHGHHDVAHETKAGPGEAPNSESAKGTARTSDAAFRGLDASPVPMPKRPASRLKAVPQNEAWKTPLQLARFHADQFLGKARTSHLTGTATALVRGGEFEKATELALLLPRRVTLNPQWRTGADVDSMLLQVVRNASEKGDSVDSKWLLKVARWIENPARRALATLEVATTLAKSGDQEGALEAIRESRVLVKDDPSIRILPRIAMAQLMVDRKQEALATARLAFNRIRAKKSDIMYSMSYQRIGQVFVRAGELQEVKRVPTAGGSRFDQATAGSLRVDLAVMMAEEGELTAALEWIGQFPDGDTPEKQNKQKAYGTIAIGLAGKGDLKQAMQVMSLAERQLRFSFTTASMKGDMAIAMATAGKIQEALKLSRLRGVGSKKVLLAISAAQWDAGQKVEARETLARAEKAGEGADGLFTKEHQTLLTMAIAYAKTGQKELAVAKIKAAVEAANDYEKNQFTRRSKEHVVAERLLDILPTVVLAGDQKLTEDIVQQAVAMAKKASSLQMAATKLVEAELYQQALKVVGMMEEAEKKRSAILGMALSLTRTSDPDEFRRFGPAKATSLKNEFTAEEQAFAKTLVTAVQEKTAQPIAKKLTTEEAAEVMAWEIGKWEIRGQGKPAEGQPHTIEMTMEARWKIEGKSIKYKFTVQESGKTVNYFGHQEYDTDRGVFVYRSKWGENPETTSHSRHDLATGTSRAQSVPTTPTAGPITTTVTKRIGADKTQQRLEVHEKGRLVYSHDVVSTRQSD